MAKRSDADSRERGSRRTNEENPTRGRGGLLSRHDGHNRADDPDRDARDRNGREERRQSGVMPLGALREMVR